VAEKRFKELIPPLFQGARMAHLSEALQGKIKSLAPTKGLLLWGSAGVGKSYAMAVIMRLLIMQGRSVRRLSWELLCLQLRDTFRPGCTESLSDVITPLIAFDGLFLEDIGTTVSTGKQESDFSLRTFLVLLDQRLEACRPTFVTTNQNVEQLAKSFDERVASRLQQACEVIHLTGEDRRAARGARKDEEKK
jgi:DNA replication protein DnaC